MEDEKPPRPPKSKVIEPYHVERAPTTTRKCLKCQKDFESHGKQNRLCGYCGKLS